MKDKINDYENKLDNNERDKENISKNFKDKLNKLENQRLKELDDLKKY